MNRTLKRIVIAIAALLAVLLAVVGIVAASFDPNDYKPQVIRMVQEKKQRTLAIPGDIKLSFFPSLGADLGKISISERNSDAGFASVERVQVSLELISLLSKKLVVDRIYIDGLRANIKRFKDGSTNFDDLLAKDESDGQQIAFDIDGIDINNANLTFDDRQQSRMLEIANLDLETGKIADGVPSELDLTANIKADKPKIDAKLAIKTGFTLALEQQHYVLKGLDAQLTGNAAGFTDMVIKAAGNADMKPAAKRFMLDEIKLNVIGKRPQGGIDASIGIPKLAITDTQVSGGKIDGRAKWTEGTRSINVDLGLPSFEGSPQAFKLPALALNATIKDDALNARAKLTGALNGDIDKLLLSSPQLALVLSGKQGDTALDGSLTTPVSINLRSQLIELPKIAAGFTLPNPGGGTLALKAAGDARVDLGKQKMAATLNGNIDQSAFKAKLGLADFSPATYTFDIGIDRLDLDRYTDKKGKGAQQDSTAGKGKTGTEQVLDLSALQDLHANGSVRVGALKAANINATNVRFDMRIDDGKLEVQPLAANLYGGSVNGALSIASGKTARIAVKQTFSGVNIGPLLKDTTGKDTLEGRGNVQLDVTGSGTTVTQIKKALNGSARIELRDGSIRGINIAQTIRNAKTKIDALRGRESEGQQTGTGSAAEKTDFSEMTGSFRIANGVAHNEDLDIKSPLIRVTGSGDINLGEERLDYLARATVVSTLQGQGGPELQALKGVTVPVRLSGPFSAIGWRIDVAGLAREAAKQKIDEKKEEVKSKLQERLQEKLKGLLPK